MLPAARDFDKSSCPQHGGGMIAALQSDVLANKRRLATAKCPCACMGPPDYVVTGSGTVQIHGTPAARATDKTMHGGVVAFGSGNVLIGGPTVGTTVGGPGRAKDCCEDLKKGRKDQSKGQNYNNCGIEASRLVLRAKNGSAPSESDLLEEAVREGNAEPADWEERKKMRDWDDKPGTSARVEKGGSTSDQREELLERHGVETEQVEQTPEAIAQAVAEGKGVITSHDAGVLWDDPDYNDSGHGVVVTGVQFDANGKPVAYITADSGKGQCARVVPAKQFEDSLFGRPTTANVTKEPLWPSARASR